MSFYGPNSPRPEVNEELFRETENELEQNAERYAELHADEPPRGRFLAAIRRVLRRSGSRQRGGST